MISISSLWRSYSLRRKTAIILGSSIIFLLLAIYLTVSKAIEKNYKELQYKTIMLDVTWINNTLQLQQSSMEKVVSDWGFWDDLYFYVQNPDSAFIKSNISNATLPYLNINALVIINKKNKILYTKAYRDSTLPPIKGSRKDNSMISLFTQGVYISHQDTISSDLYSTPEGSLIVASCPILMSNRKGISNGTVIIAKYIDQSLFYTDEFKALKNNLRLFTYSSFVKLHNNLKIADYKEGSSYIFLRNNHTAKVYTIYTDAKQQPSFVTEITVPLTIMLEANRSIRLLLLSIITIAFFLTLIMFLLLEVNVIKPIRAIINKIVGIAEKKDVSHRLQESECFEMTKISYSINHLLNAIQEAQQSLVVSEERYRRIFENVMDIYFIIDKRNRFIDISPFIYTLTGHKRVELIGIESFFVYYEEQTREALSTVMLANKEIVNYEIQIKKKDGTPIWVSINAHMIFDDHGDSIGYEGSLHDISEIMEIRFALERANKELEFYNAKLEQRVNQRTYDLQIANQKLQNEIYERIETENKLRQKTSELQTLFATFPDFLFLFDNSFRLIDFHGKIITNTLIPLNEATNHPIGEIFSFDIAQPIEKGMETVSEKEPMLKIEFSLFENNEERYYEARIILVNLNEYLLILRDMSTHKKTENALIAAKEFAELANQTKNEFLFNMRHEICTPLNAVSGCTDLLMETSINSTQKEYLQIIKSSSVNMLQMTNDILEFARIETNDVKLEDQYFILRENLSHFLSPYKQKASEKGIEFEITITDTIPSLLIGDLVKLKQVMAKLLDNALKFTEIGKISVKADLKESTEFDATIHFIVQDTGIGISKDKLTSIYQLFTQVDGSFTRRFGGIGLGLSMTKKIIELMHGHLWVESELDKGSAFHFTITFAK